jgi:hypothetical protein
MNLFVGKLNSILLDRVELMQHILYVEIKLNISIIFSKMGRRTKSSCK